MVPVPPVPNQPHGEPQPIGPWMTKFVVFVQSHWSQFVLVGTTLVALWTAYQHEVVTKPAVDKNKDAIVTTKDDLSKVKEVIQAPASLPPPPIPKDGKKETKVYKTVHLTFVVEAKQPAEVQAVLNDESLGKFLVDNRINSYLVLNTDKSDAAEAAKGFKNAVVLQDAGGHLLGVAPITTVQAIKDFIK